MNELRKNDILKDIAKNKKIVIQSFLFRYNQKDLLDNEINQLYNKEIIENEALFNSLNFKDKLELVDVINDLQEFNNLIIPKFLEKFILSLFSIDLQEQQVKNYNILIHQLFIKNPDFICDLINQNNIKIKNTTFFDSFYLIDEKSTFIPKLLINFECFNDQHLDIIGKHIKLNKENTVDVNYYNNFNYTNENNRNKIIKQYYFLKKINLLNDDFLINSYVKYNYLLLDEKYYINDLTKLEEVKKEDIDLHILMKKDFNKVLENYLSEKYKEISSFEIDFLFDKSKEFNFNMLDFLEYLETAHRFTKEYLNKVFLSKKYSDLNLVDLFKIYNNNNLYEFNYDSYFYKKYPEVMEKFILDFNLFLEKNDTVQNKNKSFKI